MLTRMTTCLGLSGTFPGLALKILHPRNPGQLATQAEGENVFFKGGVLNGCVLLPCKSVTQIRKGDS